MGNTNDVVCYAYGDDIRFAGLGLTEAEIEFIKAYEKATGEIFNIAKEN